MFFGFLRFGLLGLHAGVVIFALLLRPGHASGQLGLYACQFFGSGRGSGISGSTFLRGPSFFLGRIGALIHGIHESPHALLAVGLGARLPLHFGAEARQGPDQSLVAAIQVGQGFGQIR